LAEKFTPVPPWELGFRDARAVKKNPDGSPDTRTTADGSGQ